MGQKRTGTVEWVPGKDGKPGHYKGRISLDDGTRPWIHFEAGLSEEKARDRAASRSEKATKANATYTPKRGPKAHKPAAPIINALVESWIELLDQTDLAPATISMHKSNVKNHIAKAFGARRAEELTSGVLLPWVRAVRKDFSPSTTRNVFNTLSKLIDDAMAEEWIDLPANPTKHPKVRDALPTVEAPDPEDIAQMSEEQISTLIRDTTVSERRMRYLFQALTGTRDGEAFGAQWSSLAVEKGVQLLRVKVSLAMKGPEGHATAKQPKTKSSKRPIPLHSMLVEALEKWKVEGWAAYVGRAPKDDDPIFPDKHGKPHRPRSAELLRDDLAAAGLPEQYKNEDLDTRVFRRSFATWLEAHGVPGEHIDRLLGHAQQSVRGRHYSASDLAALRRAVETIRLDLRKPTEHESAPDTGQESSNESSETENTERSNKQKLATYQDVGGVAEWSKAAVLKVDAAKFVDGNDPTIADSRESQGFSTDSAKHATVGAKDSSGQIAEEGDPIELALAKALTVATAKGDLQLMAAALAELRERRQARAGVVVLGGGRRDRGSRR